MKPSTTNPQWEPDLYLRFERERGLPLLDLLHRLPPGERRRVADLGCGPGNSTEQLRRFVGPAAEVIGVDASAEMLASARQRNLDATWDQADLTTWAPTGKFDLIVANAVLQWVHGQASLLPRLLRFLEPGGELAVQIPTHEQSAVHQAILATAAEGPWKPKVAHLADMFEIHEASWYYDVLTPHTEVELWETEYLHVLSGPDAIIQWISGSGLRPYLQAVDDEHRGAFLEAFTERVVAAYPRQADGNVLFSFRRLFFVAQSKAHA